MTTISPSDRVSPMLYSAATARQIAHQVLQRPVASTLSVAMTEPLGEPLGETHPDRERFCVTSLFGFIDCTCTLVIPFAHFSVQRMRNKHTNNDTPHDTITLSLMSRNL